MAMLHGVAYITFGNIGQPCVMQAILNKLDALLLESDSDSIAWADGGGAEQSDEWLRALSEREWLEFGRMVASRNAQ